MIQRRLPLAGAALAIALMASACSLARLPTGQPRIPPLPQTSLMLDDRGHLITELDAGINRTLVPLSQVPVIVRNAVIAVEDSGFYAHHGIDLRAVVRAAYQDARSGHIVEGGSTITEQLVKNTITGGDETLGRKVREAVLAYRLENEYSKDQILEMYLNTVYFGQGAYGIQAAAKAYFSVPSSRLSLTQGATLAALISSPSNYDPVFHPKVALARRNVVLSRMSALHMIDGPAYQRAVRAKLGLQPADPRGPYPAPYFVDYVKRWFLADPEFGATYEDRYNRLFEGGLRIYTTVDLRLQREAEEAVNGILNYRTDPYGAMTVLDPRTGAIRAMVGGRNWFSRTDPYAKLNLATGGATGRQAGSAFKPFTLVTALEQGISPGEVFSAPPHIDITLPPGYSPSIWPVSNYDGEGGGSMTVEQATIHSINTVYAQLIMQVGAANVVRTAHQMGITSKLRAYPSAVLGVNEVNTLEMADAFGTLATVGRHVPPMAVSKITDAGGNVIYQAAPQPQQVLQPSVAWVTDQILEKVIQEGTGTEANIGRPAAGKTGTAQDWTNAWFVGFVPQLTAAVWVGFPRGQIPMIAPRTRLPHVLGGTWPAEIWHTFMVNALQHVPPQDFPQPEIHYATVRIDITQGCVANRYTLPSAVRVVRYLDGTQPQDVCALPAGPQQITLPSVVGLSQGAATALLASYDLQVSVTTMHTAGIRPGTVVAEVPSPGTAVLQGVTVTIVVASPPRPSPPPSPTPSPSPSPTPSPSPS
jgi:penicillin-binding protein 1A